MPFWPCWTQWGSPNQDKYHLYQILFDGSDAIWDGVCTRVGDGDGAFYGNHRDEFRATWARDVGCARVRLGGDNGGIAVRNRKSAWCFQIGVGNYDGSIAARCGNSVWSIRIHYGSTVGARCGFLLYREFRGSIEEELVLSGSLGTVVELYILQFSPPVLGASGRWTFLVGPGN